MNHLSLPPVEKRLDSWKSIARHLGRSCRTVQRWHRIYGLPVLRVGGKTGSVFAFAHELDLWMKSGRSPLHEEPDENRGPIPIRPALAVKSVLNPENNFDSSPVSGESQEQSKALVALGARIWRVLSFSNLQAMAHAYQEAIDQDCFNASAFAGLSSALILQALLGQNERQSAYTAAKAAWHRAAELAPDLPEVQCLDGWIKICIDRDWHGARKALEQAGGEPTLTSRIQVGMGLLSVVEGRLAEASALLRSACLQSALNVVWAGLHSWSSYFLGDYPYVLNLSAQHRSNGRKGMLLDAVEALALMQLDDSSLGMDRIRALAANAPENSVVRGVLGHALAVSGQTEEARGELRSMISSRVFEQNHYAIALILVGLGEKHEALNRLQQSYRDGSLWSLGFGSDPMLIDLRDHHQFKSFLSYPTTISRSAS